MSAVTCWPHWTVARAIAMLAIGRENISVEHLAAELDCDEDDALAVIDQAVESRLGGCFIYSKAEAH